MGGSFEDFAAGVDGDDALTYTLGSNQVNIIRYLQAGRVMLIGTSGGDLSSPARGRAAIADKRCCEETGHYGSADIQPVQVANVTLFVQRAKAKAPRAGV